MEYRAVLNEVMAYHLGKMDLIARVTDQHGIVSVARLDSFKINHIPSVTLPVAQNPIKTLIAPASLELVALTEDASGEKTVRVDFYANGKLVGSQVKDAIWRGWYGFTWNNVEAGEYTVTAVVTDDNGATATSAPLKIKVRRAPR
jgi:hypothetical protein